MKRSQHRHRWSLTRRHENENRIRTRFQCRCGAVRYGCLALRTDPDGHPSWGNPGMQNYWVKLPHPMWRAHG